MTKLKLIEGMNAEQTKVCRAMAKLFARYERVYESVTDALHKQDYAFPNIASEKRWKKIVKKREAAQAALDKEFYNKFGKLMGIKAKAGFSLTYHGAGENQDPLRQAIDWMESNPEFKDKEEQERRVREMAKLDWLKSLSISQRRTFKELFPSIKIRKVKTK